MKAKKIVVSAVIAAIYSVLTILLMPISFGVVQIRIAEALTVLPAMSPMAIWGVFIGCLVANIYTGSIVDIIIGSVTTLIAAMLTYKLKGHKWLLPLPPVILNGVAVGGYLTYMYGGIWYVNMLTIALGQLVSCYFLGLPLLMLAKKNKQINKFLK